MPQQTRQPRIAIAHDFLTRLGGAERVAAVLADIFPHAPIYTLLYDAAGVGAIFPPWRVQTSHLQRLPAFLRRRAKWLLPFFPQAVEAMDFSDYDIVLTSSTAWMQGIVTGTQTRQICYCHSPARFLWDWAHAYQKENKISGIKKWLARPILRSLRIWNRLSAHRVDTFLANSKTVQQRIAKYYRRDAAVLYPPVDTDRIARGNSHENYFLIVSQLTSYKKLDQAISVFNKLRRRLVIVGEGPQKEYLQAIAGPTVELLGRQSDETIATLLQHCRGFILPGEEDFGIAPVEAMAAGKPVLALGRGGATETVIDVRSAEKGSKAPTGVLFAEPTARSLEDGLAILLAHEKAFDAIKIRQHAEQFTEAAFREKIEQIVAATWEAMQADETSDAKLAA